MNVGRCYTAPAEYLANCAIPALGWKWSADFEIIESGDGATLLWSGELREILQQAQGLGLPNLRMTLILAAALLRREVFLQSVPASRPGPPEALVELARALKTHPLLTQLEGASPLPYQAGLFIRHVFQHLEIDGFFGGDARHVIALLEGQVNYRQLRKRLSSSPLNDPLLGAGFAEVQRLLKRLNEIAAADILDLWKTGHSHLATYDEALTTLGRPTTLGRMIEALVFPQAAEAGAAFTPVRTPEEALREIARLEGGEIVQRAARGVFPALHFPSLQSRAVTSQQGGYSDIARHGSIDRVLLSQLAYDPDEFLRRFAENELLYYQNEAHPDMPTQPLTCLIDMGVAMWGRPRLLAAGCALAAWKSAWAKQRPFELFQTFFGEAVRLPLDQPRQLADILTGIDDSESPVAALNALWKQQRKALPQSDLLLITSPAAWHSPALAQALAPMRAGWRIFGITLDRHEEMRFWQNTPASSRLINRVDFRCLVPNAPGPAAGSAGARGALAAEPDRMFPDLFRLGHREAITALAFTPDCSLLFSGDSAGRICWWSPLRKTLDQESVLPRPGLAVQGLTAGSTVLAVFAVEPSPGGQRGEGGRLRAVLLRYDLITNRLLDEFVLPVEPPAGAVWPKLSPDQNQIALAFPGQVLVVTYPTGSTGAAGATPELSRIEVPGTPIACVQGRRWEIQYLLTEQRNLFRIELAGLPGPSPATGTHAVHAAAEAPAGGICRHLRPEPGAQIAVDKDGAILALRGRDLVLYPANPNQNSGPSDEAIVATLREATWQDMQGAWDGSLLLSSARQTLFLPVEARNKPVTLPQTAGKPWAISPWSRLVAAATQREVRVFHARKGEMVFAAPALRLQSSVMNMFFGPDGDDLYINYGAASGHHWQWKTALTFQPTAGQPPPPRSINYSLVNSAVHRIEFYAGKSLIAMERHRISLAGSRHSWNSCDGLVCCAVHPADSHLAVLDSRNIVWLLRVSDLRLVAALAGCDDKFAGWSAAGLSLGDGSLLGTPGNSADFAGFAAGLRAEIHPAPLTPASASADRQAARPMRHSLDGGAGSAP